MMKKHRCGETLHDRESGGEKLGGILRQKSVFETGWMRVKRRGKNKRYKNGKTVRIARSSNDAPVAVYIRGKSNKTSKIATALYVVRHASSLNTAKNLEKFVQDAFLSEERGFFCSFSSSSFHTYPAPL